MIVIDTHIWLWWVHDDPKLSSHVKQLLVEHEDTGIGLSAISCWEVAKLVEYKRLTLPLPVLQWLEEGLSYAGVRLIPLTPQLVAEATQLPGDFHRDPADQIIVATARVHDAALVTADSKILAYPHVRLVPNPT